jgi:sigma-B regulation protein RsbU (phosphoserine phosphatase)
MIEGMTDLARARHDLRDPVNHILGYVEILLEEDQVPASFHEDLERIRLGGRRMLEQIQVYFGGTKTESVPLDLRQIQHDLRTPVNQIRGYSEILVEEAERLGLKTVIPDLRRIHDAARNWLIQMERLLLPELTPVPGPTSDPARQELLANASPTPSTSSGILAPGEAWLNQARVLVVDDDPTNHDILDRRLRRHGLNTTGCGDGREALGLLRTESFDLVLLSVGLPGINGFQVLITIKSDPELRHIPVLMVSGFDGDDRIARCIEAGADDYLTKPFNPVLLRARVGSCIEMKRRRDQEQATYQALVASQQRLAAELAEAGAYVQSLLPAPLSNPIFADWAFQPSAQLGGDAFDYQHLDDEHFAVCLLDVCGHGVGAALLGVSALNVVRSQALPGTDFRDPAAVLTGLNRAFPMERQNQQYFTAWYGVYNRSRQELRYASGGHPPALLFGESSDPVSLRTPAPPIGCFPDTVYLNRQVAAQAGSELFVLSDGVYELPLPEGRCGTLAEFVAWLRDIRMGAFVPQDALVHARNRQGRTELDDDYSLIRVRLG